MCTRIVIASEDNFVGFVKSPNMLTFPKSTNPFAYGLYEAVGGLSHASPLTPYSLRISSFKIDCNEIFSSIPLFLTERAADNFQYIIILSIAPGKDN